MEMSRRSMILGSAALASTTIAAKAIATTADKARIANCRTIVRDLLAANAIPAFSIAVLRRDEVLWAEAFGQADLELGVTAAPSHRFRLGSVSKIITATLAARLAARGDVDLDAGIATYMPALPAQHHATTLRQLLTHRGGIRHYTDKDDAATPPGPIDKRAYLSTADVLAVFIDDPLIAKPGDGPNYSTFGYTLASLVLEAAANTPFLELVQREIAAPLALASLAADEPFSLVSNRVSGYVPSEYVRKTHPSFSGKFGNAPQNNPVYKWAGGGLLATPTDLARFGAAHLAPGALSAAALETLFTVYTARTERSPPLGLGWRIDTDSAGRKRWHHAGGQDGARASLVVYPESGLSIAFATNISQTPGDVLGPSEKFATAWS
jgi:serine beta-lactamase-like protein LACTB, mitochondrial